MNDSEKSPVYEEMCFKWDTVLPYNYELPWISSPEFNILNANVCLFVSIDPARTYTVQLVDTDNRLKNLTFKYYFHMFFINKEGKSIRAFYCSDHHFQSRLITFFSFHKSEIRKDYCKGMPVLMELTISECENGYSIADKCIQTPSYLNARRNHGSLSEDLRVVLEQHKNADVIVECGDEVINGHSFVFNSRSDVFKRMIDYNKKIKFEYMDVSYFKDLICYLYTDEMPELNFEKAKVFYELADMYALTDLMSRCREFLIEHLTEMEACRCVALADLHYDRHFKETVIEYILVHKVYLHDEVWNPFYEALPNLACDIINAA